MCDICTSLLSPLAALVRFFLRFLRLLSHGLYIRSVKLLRVMDVEGKLDEARSDMKFGSTRISATEKGSDPEMVSRRIGHPMTNRTITSTAGLCTLFSVLSRYCLTSRFIMSTFTPSTFSGSRVPPLPRNAHPTAHAQRREVAVNEKKGLLRELSRFSRLCPRGGLSWVSPD